MRCVGQNSFRFLEVVSPERYNICAEFHWRVPRMGIAGSIMAQLDKVWRQQRLSLSTKLRIYTSLVQSVVLYGSTMWTLDNAQSRQWQNPVFSYVGTASYPWYQMVWQGIQRRSQWENKTTRHTISYCWQTSFIIWSHLSPTGEHTCFASTATGNRSPHRHSSRRWLEAPAGSSTEKLAATSGRRQWPICWCCPDRGPGSFNVEDATTLSWSSAAVSEWVPSSLGVLRLESVDIAWTDGCTDGHLTSFTSGEIIKNETEQ